MARSKTTKRALVASVCATLMCIAMLIGTTFAWFTDTASTSVNKIQSGTLDVELWQVDADAKLSSSALTWVKADGHTEEAVLWEPGATYNLESFRIKNNGNLALKYKVIISGIIGDAKLLDAIDFTVKVGDGAATTLANWDGALTAGAVTDKITITGTMKTTAGNEYQDLTIDGIAITVVATQFASEYDSSSNTYDADAVLPVYAIAKGNLNLTADSTTGTAKVLAEQTLSDNVMKVTYPANVLLKSNISVDGTTDKKATVEQELKYVDDTPSEAMSNVTIGADKAVASYDLTLPVADRNTVLVTATINYAKGLTGVQIYHTGNLLATSAAADGETAKEYATYDSETGVITLHLFKASPIDIVYNNPSTTKVVKTEDELRTAIAANDGKTIVLDNDLSPEKYINVANDATIDLNRHTITGDIWGENVFVVNGAVNFTVKNGKFVVEEKSAILMAKGSGSAGSWDASGCNVVVENVDFDVQSTFGSAIEANINTESGGKLTVNGGTINVSGTSASGLDIGYCTTASITGVTINVTKESGNCIETGGADVDLTNCKLIFNYSGSWSVGGHNIYISANTNKKCNLNLYNCTIENNQSEAAVWNNYGSPSSYSYYTVTNLYNTNITAAKPFGVYRTSASPFYVHSGTYSSEVKNGSCGVNIPTTSTVTSNTDGTWTVSTN